MNNNIYKTTISNNTHKPHAHRDTYAMSAPMPGREAWRWPLPPMALSLQLARTCRHASAAASNLAAKTSSSRSQKEKKARRRKRRRRRRTSPFPFLLPPFPAHTHTLPYSLQAFSTPVLSLHTHSIAFPARSISHGTNDTVTHARLQSGRRRKLARACPGKRRREKVWCPRPSPTFSPSSGDSIAQPHCSTLRHATSTMSHSRMNFHPNPASPTACKVPKLTADEWRKEASLAGLKLGCSTCRYASGGCTMRFGFLTRLCAASLN